MAIETVNPTTGERLRSFPALTPAEIEDKLAAAYRAAPSWRATPLAARVSVVRRAGELLDERKADYGHPMTLRWASIKSAIEEAAKRAPAAASTPTTHRAISPTSR
jgi:succinate-semialdehyde dehydrogenase/glutarate-semialdehyde dehydrogenase